MKQLIDGTRLRPQLRVLLSSVMLTVTAAPSLAQSDGLENWIDACDVTDPAIVRLLAAECALVPQGAMIPHHGVYDLIPDTFTYRRDGDPNNVDDQYCANTKFYGQIRAAGSSFGRSGLLVGPDLVLTAGHFVEPPYEDECLSSWYFVFGYQSSLSKSGQCVPPQITAIPAENVYSCAEIVVRGQDTGTGDFLLVRLDRPVSGRAPVRVRRSGSGDLGDRMVAIGHPDQLSTKVDVAASFVDEQVIASFGKMVRVREVHLLKGSSGSMYYNLDQDLLESVVVGGGCLVEADSLPNQCTRWIGSGCDLYFGFGSPIIPFAPNIPPLDELLVSNSGTVVHRDMPDGSVTDPDTTYQLSVPASASGRIWFEITDPSAGNTYIVAPPGISYTLTLPGGRSKRFLNPGESATLVIHASAGAMPPGTQSCELHITNDTNRFRDRLKHVFEIGFTEFVVEGPAEFVASGVAPPYTDSATYLARNVRPVPVTVRAAVTGGWLELRSAGLASGASTLTFTLAPAGLPGDSRDVVCSVKDAFASQLGVGTYPGAIDFTNQSPPNGLNLGDSSRRASLEIHRAIFDSANAVVIPDGDPAGVEVAIAVSGGFHVCDLDLQTVITGIDPVELHDFTQLRCELIAPSGAVVLLWDHHAGGPGTALSFDDENSPAPTGALLSGFDGVAADGSWRLRVVDDVPGIAHRVKGAQLRVDPLERPVCGP